MRRRIRRSLAGVIAAIAVTLVGSFAASHADIFSTPPPAPAEFPSTTGPVVVSGSALPSADVLELLAALTVKGRAPKTGYVRSQFGRAWDDKVPGVQFSFDGCSTRSNILLRDLRKTVMKAGDRCTPIAGILDDPYTGRSITYRRTRANAMEVQIDHIVALSNSWQTGAAQWAPLRRLQLANDPDNLQATDGGANQQKSDGDAATWLPPNKTYRCEYVSRQVRVKAKYRLWVTPPEKAAITRVLSSC